MLAVPRGSLWLRMARPGRAAGMSCEPGTGPFHGAGIAVGCWGCRYPLAPHPWGCVEQGKAPLSLKFPLGLRGARGDLLQEAQLAAFLLPGGSAGLRQKQPLVLTEKAPGSGARLGASFPLPSGFGRCRSRSAAKLPHPRLLFGGGGRRKGWRLRFAGRFRRGGASRER